MGTLVNKTNRDVKVTIPNMREFQTFYSDNEGVIGMFFKRDWIEETTTPEQPVEGLDVTDFCKPIDPGIAQCVADHWWEMLGEESSNKKPGADCHELKKHILEWTELMVGASFPEQDGDYISEQDYRNVIKQTARHFAEWQAEKDARDMYMSDNRHFEKVYELGKKDMRKEMLEGAVEAVVTTNLANRPIIYLDQLQGFQYGDKVRVIVIKEEQK